MPYLTSGLPSLILKANVQVCVGWGAVLTVCGRTVFRVRITVSGRKTLIILLPERADKLVYPEFKGYHANLYWATIQGKQNAFTVYAATDGVFFRVFTPDEPRGRQDGIHTMPDFPAGDLSFLLDIPAIRSFKPISQHGPQSQPGTIRIKKGDEGLKLELAFDFL